MIILGSGYVGLALARTALAAGEPVAALTRNPDQAAALRALGVAPVVVADLAGSDWHRTLNPADGDIVNCVSPSSSGVEGYRHSFLDGLDSIRHWLEKSSAQGHQPARSIVFTSSTAVYPQADGSWVDETTLIEPTTLGPGGAVLREAEERWLALSPQLAQRSWVLRLAGIYGPDRHHLLDTLRAGEKSFPGGGGHWVNLIYRDDIVSAIRACFTARPEITGGIFNVVDDEPVLKKDLVTWLAQRLGQNPAALQFDETLHARAIHRRTASGVIPHRRISSFKLQKTLAWAPQCHSYREGYELVLGQ
jgi:nucleoside-diphosphate-sugar epimerase